jgi:plastocyanin
MERASASFVAIEKALRQGSAAGIDGHAKALVDGFAKLLPRRIAAAEGGPDPDAYARQVMSEATHLAVHSKAGHLPDARIALQRIRLACVACHATSRPANDGRGWFPALGNTVWGRVDVRTVKGEKQAQSGGTAVFIDSVPGAADGAVAPYYPRLSQREQRFAPRILPIVVGTEVEFPNDDLVFHNVFSLSKTKHFDLGVYGKDQIRRQRFEKTGLVRLYCHIHASMSASILVLANPFFAVTDGAGYYFITGVPDGTHTLRSWHELGGGTNSKVELTGGATRRHDIAVRETRVRMPHTNKFGKPYREKY